MISHLKYYAAHTILLLAIPQITNIESTSRHPRTGEPFSIECTATGIPKPEISWRLKGTVLNDTDIYTCDSKFNIIPNPSRNSSRLRISAASNEFNGTYECIIFNDAGSDSKSIDIYLQGQLHIIVTITMKWSMQLNLSVIMTLFLLLHTHAHC